MLCADAGAQSCDARGDSGNAELTGGSMGAGGLTERPSLIGELPLCSTQAAGADAVIADGRGDTPAVSAGGRRRCVLLVGQRDTSMACGAEGAGGPVGPERRPERGRDERCCRHCAGASTRQQQSDHLA